MRLIFSSSSAYHASEAASKEGVPERLSRIDRSKVRASVLRFFMVLRYLLEVTGNKDPAGAGSGKTGCAMGTHLFDQDGLGANWPGSRCGPR